MTQDDTLSEALRYAARGWAVFPLRGKRPIVKWGTEATTDPEVIVSWFAGADERLGVGISCGPSGLLVIDFDDEAALARYGPRMPPTLIAETPRGAHYYYRGAGRNTAGLLAVGVDTRGVGGFVVAPPTLHRSGARYSWANELEPVDVPRSILDRLARKPRQLAPRVGLPSEGGSANLRANCNGVRAATRGGRNAALNLAAFNTRALGLSILDSAPELVAAGLEVGLDRDEVIRTVASGLGTDAESVAGSLS